MQPPHATVRLRLINRGSSWRQHEKRSFFFREGSKPNCVVTGFDGYGNRRNCSTYGMRSQCDCLHQPKISASQLCRTEDNMGDGNMAALWRDSRAGCQPREIQQNGGSLKLERDA